MVVDQATKSSSDPYDREEHAQAFCACIQWLGLASSGAPVLQMFRWTLMDSKMEMVNLGLGRLFPPHGSGGEVGSENESEQHPVWRNGNCGSSRGPSASAYGKVNSNVNGVDVLDNATLRMCSLPGREV